MSSSEKAAEPPFHVQMQIVDSAAALHYLAIRQSAWTVALNNAASEPDEDGLEAIADVGNEVDAQFADIGKHTDRIRTIFEQYGPWLNERISAALASGQYSEEQVAALRRVTGADDDDFASRGAALAGSLFESVPGIRTQLKDGIGGVPGGLLLVDGASAGCGMMAAASMLGLAVCPKTAGAGCAVGAAGLIGMVALGC
jgi:hypothetical protein